MAKLITETRPHFISQNSVQAYTMLIVNSMVCFGAVLVSSVGDQTTMGGLSNLHNSEAKKMKSKHCIPRIDQEITHSIDKGKLLGIMNFTLKVFN